MKETHKDEHQHHHQQLTFEMGKQDFLKFCEEVEGINKMLQPIFKQEAQE